MAARVAFALHRRVATEVATVDAAGAIPSPSDDPRRWREVWHLDVFHTTGLEGGLAAHEVKAVLDDQRVLGHHPLADYMSIVGYAAAARAVYLTRPSELHHTPVTARAVHWLWEQARGPVQRLPVFGEAASTAGDPGVDLARLRRELADAHRLTVRSPVCTVAAAVEATVHRAWPESAGRVLLGRLAANLTLAQHGYPPAIVPRRDRARHAAAIASAEDDLDCLAALIARGVLDSMHRFPAPSLTGPHRLVALAALDLHDVSPDALRVAAHRGRLRAHRGEDGVWRSTQQWVDEYLANRYRRARELAVEPQSSGTMA